MKEGLTPVIDKLSGSTTMSSKNNTHGECFSVTECRFLPETGVGCVFVYSCGYLRFFLTGYRSSSSSSSSSSSMTMLRFVTAAFFGFCLLFVDVEWLSYMLSSSDRSMTSSSESSLKNII